MAEIPENQEKIVRAHTAINEYQYYSPESSSSAIADLLDGWIEACEGVNFTPEEMRQQAWLYAERVFAETMTFAPEGNEAGAEDFRRFVDEYLRKAEKIMARAYSHKDADSHLKTLIDWENGAFEVVRGYLTGDRHLFLSSHSAYSGLQNKLIIDLADEYVREGGIETYTLGHAATVSAMIMARTGKIIPVPTSPRMRRYGIDTEHRSDLILLGQETMLLGVSDEPGGYHHINVPFGALRQQRGKHTDGMLVGVTLAMESNALIDAVSFGRELPKGFKINQSLATLSDGVVKMITEQMAAHKSAATPEVHITQNPFEWYETLSPLRHPYIVDAERLEEGLAHAEMALLEDGLSQEGATLAAWMYVESGFGRALHPIGNRISPIGDFERSDFMLRHAYEKSSETATVEHYEMLLAFAAHPMYAAIALGEALPFEEYAKQLAALGENIGQFYVTLPDKEAPDAIRTNDLMKIITTCLVSATDPAQSWIVVPSSPRQRGSWHMAVWQKTKGKFVPQRAGRLALHDEDTMNLYSQGIAAVTPKMLGQKAQNTYVRTLYYLIDHVASTESEDPKIDSREVFERNKTIGRVRSEVMRSVKAATN